MVFTTLAAAAAISSSPAEVELKVTGASLFKNGYAFVVREAAIPADGELIVKSPPVGVLGTFWIAGSKGVTLTEIVATKVKADDVERHAASLDEILSLNVGKKVTLDVSQYSQSMLPTVTGTILLANGPLLIMQTAAGRQAFNKSVVQRITSEGELIYSTKSASEANALRIRAKGSGSVYVMALQSGMTWAPAYHVDITDDKKLKVTSKATILNDLSPMDRVDVKLITGFPNVQLWRIDPMTSGQVIPLISPAAPGRAGFVPMGIQMVSYDPTDNSLVTQADGETLRRLEQNVGAGLPDTPGEGMQAEDLFFYKQPNVSLKVGDRGYYVLFQAESEYEHLYTLDLGPQTIQPRQPQIMPVPEPPAVWHALKFKNTAGQPLTTGPAITVQNGEVLGQDMLKYVSKGADAILRITKALDVFAEEAEEEVSRERGALKLYNNPTHDLVQVNGTIEVTNRKPTPVKMKITKDLVGEVTEAGQSGKVVKTAKGLNAVNANSRVEWNPELKPGEKATLTYAYKVYVDTRGY